MLRRSLVAAVVALFAIPAAAHAASGLNVINDCTTSSTGELTKTYSIKDYQAALANLPTDTNEYTDCKSIIERAELAAIAAKKKTTKKKSSSSSAKKSSKKTSSKKSSKSGRTKASSNTQTTAAGATGGSSGSGSSGSSSSGSSHGSSTGSSSEAYRSLTADAQNQVKQDALHVAQGGSKARTVANAAVTPGSLSYDRVSSISKLPMPLLVLAILILVAVLGLSGYFAYERFGPGRRHA